MNNPETPTSVPWSAIEILGGLACLTFSGGNPAALILGGVLIAHGLSSKS